MTPALPFVLATRNADKAREIVEIFVALSGTPLVAYSVDGIAFVVDGPERIAASVAALPTSRRRPTWRRPGARSKRTRGSRRALADAFGLLAVADDTGLEVDALQGAPGVYSARYAGEDASYADNVVKLLAELEGVYPALRTARFATVAIARGPDGHEVVARGEVDGLIAAAPRGDRGFGYDPVFVPVEGDGRSFAEMTPEEKHAVSHRGRAFRALATALSRRS